MMKPKIRPMLALAAAVALCAMPSASAHAPPGGELPVVRAPDVPIGVQVAEGPGGQTCATVWADGSPLATACVSTDAPDPAGCVQVPLARVCYSITFE